MPQGPNLSTNNATGTPISSAEVNYLHGYLKLQLPGALSFLGAGVLSRVYGATSLAVTAGTGLQVLVSPGAGVLVGATLPTAYIERAAQLALAVAPSATLTIWAALESNASNKTEATGLPRIFADTSNVMPDAIALAVVVTGASAITSITDARGPFIDTSHLVPSIVTVTATATIAATTDIHQVNAAAATNQTLPATLTNQLGILTLKNIGAGAVTPLPNSGQTIESVAAGTIAQGPGRVFYLDASTSIWRVR